MSAIVAVDSTTKVICAQQIQHCNASAVHNNEPTRQAFTQLLSTLSTSSPVHVHT
jgi:hypothetical protein